MYQNNVLKFAKEVFNTISCVDHDFVFMTYPDQTINCTFKENGRKSTSPDSLNGSSKEDDDVSTTSESLNDLFLDEFEVRYSSLY